VSVDADRALDVAGRFADASGYLNTASSGLPPDTAWAAFAEAAERWRTGRCQPQDFDATITAARAVWARLLHVPASWVAIGPQVSPLVGLVAASLPDDAEVLVADGQFASTLFPWLVQERRGVTVRSVPFAELADAVRPSTTLVAIEAVRSADGLVADLGAITAAARAHGARILADTTHGTGWLDVDAGELDYVVCGTYKWLLSPRGTAFLAVRPELQDGILPHAAGWYAGEEIWDSIYGEPLRLASDARRFDISPAWLCWEGTLPALEMIEEIGVAAIAAHDLALANRFRGHLGLAPSNSPIVSVAVEGAGERLARAGIAAATRAGAARLSFHLYNSAADADRAAEALRISA
jgi:selenocysteine lyase/cysteine desulfurase